MQRKLLFLVMFSLLVTTGTCTALTDEEELGKQLYFDTDLSTPAGMSCSSCHDPAAGYADPDSNLPVSQGVLPNRFGNRNSPTSAYAAFSPEFTELTVDGETQYIGGQFWDGRAANLTEQAKGPFLNPLEMHNPGEREVVIRIRNSDYAEDFEDITGVDLSDMSEDNINLAYDRAAGAIAAYESTSELNQFSSKYDYFMAGEAELTDEEAEGLVLFNENCMDCHSYVPDDADKDVFTDYSYHNLGTPANPDNPFYDVARKFNPEGSGYIDYGLGGSLGLASENGKMKVPTLRNVAVTAPYMHNGVFSDLNEVVSFLNTRDCGEWPASEVDNEVDTSVGNLGLTEDEVDDIVAFLETLTDGYVPPEEEQ